MHKSLRAILILLIVISFAGCDQATKSIAKRELQFSTSVTLVGGLVRLHYAENEGGFLSIGSELPVVVHRLIAILLTCIVLVGLILLLSFAQNIKLSSLILFSLLLAGSLGNLIDRLFNHGRVVDFLILGTNTIHTGILNIADLLIITSILMLFIAELLCKRAG